MNWLDLFGATPLGVLALASIHFHLFRLTARVQRIENTPTVAKELPRA